MKSYHQLDWPRDRPYFIREVIIPLALNHPGIVNVLGFCFPCLENRNTGIIIQELMRNGTLEDALKAKFAGRPPVGFDATKLSKVIFGVAVTMKQLHLKKMIYGQLNPSNVLLDDHWEPKLIDFQYVKFEGLNFSNKYGDQIFPKSQLFTAPEYWGDDYGDDFHYPVDVYAFAVFMYACFTSQQGEFNDGLKGIRSSAVIMRNVRNGLRLVRQPGIPDGYWNLIERCWAHGPESRPGFVEIVRDMRGSDHYVVPGTNLQEYREYQNRICSRDLPSDGLDELIKRICVGNIHD